MSITEIENKINEFLHLKLFSPMKKIIADQEKDRLVKSIQYLESDTKKRSNIIQKHYKQIYEAMSSFLLDFRSIFALVPLVEQELKIRNFTSEEIFRIKVDYIYNDIEFSAFYPAHYTMATMKELEDCLYELNDKKYSHIVSNYIPKKDTERSPHPPLTNAELKYSAFYLFGFEPEEVSNLSLKLYRANLITDINTNGWNIDDKIVESIISVLNQKFEIEQVLQYKRVFTDHKIDRMKSECIRPVKFSNSYFPKNIADTVEFRSIDFKENSHEAFRAKKLYEFIFYITLSTQLKNSIYDTSTLEIQVGQKKLKAESNSLIKGQANWELLTGDMIKRITNNSNSMYKQTTVIPEIKPDTLLTPNEIYKYGYNKKRPSRYGVGRYVTQILEKYSIGSAAQHDDILKNLVNSNAVHIIEKMIHPQNHAIAFISFVKEYMPLLVDFEYLHEIEEKIELASRDKITVQSIIKELESIIELGFNQIGYIPDDSNVTQNKIQLVKAIALKNNLQLSPDVFKSNAKIDMIIAQYPMAEQIKIGSCPNCNFTVYQKEYINNNTGEISYYFACEENNKTCSFILWDSYIYKYFSMKKLELSTIEERADTLKKIISKKRGYTFNGLVAKNGKTYDARINTESYIDRDTSKEKWRFKLDFVNRRKKS